MYPKPEKHARIKARQLRSYARDRAACVAAVWKRGLKGSAKNAARPCYAHAKQTCLCWSAMFTR